MKKRTKTGGKMRKIAAILTVIALISGCSTNQSEDVKSKEAIVEPVRADLIIHPSPVEVEQEVTIEAILTQFDEKVDDADKVVFEIMKTDENKSWVKEGNNEGEGIYSAKETFNEAGTYVVIAHVTARNMHVMPQREFEVVDLEAQKEEKAEEEHHHSSHLLIHFDVAEEVRVNEQTELKAHISYKNEALKNARVRFEVWKEGQEKHEFINSVETVNGEYTAQKAFPEKGIYNIKIHVNNDEGLHEHQVEMINVR